MVIVAALLGWAFAPDGASAAAATSHATAVPIAKLFIRFEDIAKPPISWFRPSVYADVADAQHSAMIVKTPMTTQPSRRNLLTGIAGGALSLGLAPGSSQAAPADSFYRARPSM